MRIKELDGIRGIACLMVVLFHYTTRYSISFGSENTVKWINFNYGGLGVVLFFILSGFVIFMSIDRSIGVKEFLIKRFIRLYPTFWFCVFITFFIVNNGPIEKYHKTFSDLIVNLTMIPGVFNTPRIDGVYWSLLPELMFYFFIAVLIFFKWTDQISKILIGWLVLILINEFIDIMPIRILFNLDYGVYFILGICFYRNKFRRSNFQNHLLIITSITTLILTNEFDIRLSIILGLVLFFYYFSNYQIPFLKGDLFIFLGKISYPMYLLHQNIGYTIIYYLESSGISNGIILFTAPLLTTITISFIITEYFEKSVIKNLKALLL